MNEIRIKKIEQLKNEIEQAVLGVDALIKHFDHPAGSTEVLRTAWTIQEFLGNAVAQLDEIASAKEAVKC